MGVDYYTCLVCQESVCEEYTYTLHVYQNKTDYNEKNNNCVEIDHVCEFCIFQYTGEEPCTDGDNGWMNLLIKKGKPFEYYSYKNETLKYKMNKKTNTDNKKEKTEKVKPCKCCNKVHNKDENKDENKE